MRNVAPVLSLWCLVALPAFAAEDAPPPAAPEAAVEPALVSGMDEPSPIAADEPSDPVPEEPTTPAKEPSAALPEQTGSASDTATKPQSTMTAADVAAARARGALASQGGSPFHISASLTNYVGAGTFVMSNATNPMVASWLSLSPFLVLDKWQLAASQSLSFEWTQNDSSAYAYQVQYGDTRLSARYLGFALPDQNVYFALSGAYSVPISLMSRQAGSLGGLGAGARASWLLPELGLNAYAGVSGTANVLVPQLASPFAGGAGNPYEDRGLGTTPTRTCILRNPDEQASYACTNIPNVANASASLGGNWTFADNQLTLNVDLSLSTLARAYISPDDALRAANARAGIGHNEASVGSVTLTYQPLNWIALSVGSQSWQPLLTADGKWVRFPFWDFVSARNNFSSLFLDTTVTF